MRICVNNEKLGIIFIRIKTSYKKKKLKHTMVHFVSLFVEAVAQWVGSR